MTPIGMSTYAQHIELVLFFGLMAILFNWIAIQNDFYKIPKDFDKITVPFIQVLGAFSIYIAISFFLPTIVVTYLKKALSNPFEKTPLSIYGWAQLLSISSCFFFSGCFLIFLINPLIKRSGKTAAFPKTRA